MNARLPGRWDGGGLAVGTGRTGLRRAGRGASLPAIPFSFVAGHHVSRAQRAFGGPPANRTWCFTSRKPLFLRRRAPRPSDPADLRRTGRGASLPASPSSFVRGTTSTRSGGHRVPTLKTKPEGNSRPRISLPLTVGGNFPLSPTAPSPRGAAPSGKHCLPASSPEVLPIPNQEGCALLKSICCSVRHIPPISTKTKGSGARGCRFLLLPLFEGNPRPSPVGDFRLLSSILFHGKPVGIPEGFSGRNSRYYSCKGISVMSSRRDSRRILRMGPPEELLISPSLPTSFPSTD